jgi:hypothetical protein
VGIDEKDRTKGGDDTISSITIDFEEQPPLANAPTSTFDNFDHTSKSPDYAVIIHHRKESSPTEVDSNSLDTSHAEDDYDYDYSNFDYPLNENSEDYSEYSDEDYYNYDDEYDSYDYDPDYNEDGDKHVNHDYENNGNADYDYNYGYDDYIDNDYSNNNNENNIDNQFYDYDYPDYPNNDVADNDTDYDADYDYNDTEEDNDYDNLDEKKFDDIQYDENIKFRVPKKKVRKHDTQKSVTTAAPVKQVPIKRSKVNNFGFPLSFGRAIDDFPLIDPNNIPNSDFSCLNKAYNG